MKKEKSQAATSALIIMFVLMAFAVSLFYTQIYDVISKKSNNYDEIADDARVISRMLLTKGYPYNWDNSTVKRIGITDGEHIDGKKIDQFSKMNYNVTKKLLGTRFDYLIFFQNESNDYVSVGDICYLGNPVANMNLSQSVIYYSYGDGYLRDYLEGRSGIFIASDISDFMNNFRRYDLVVLENARLTKDYLDEVQGYVVSGGKVIFSYEVYPIVVDYVKINWLGVDILIEDRNRIGVQNGSVNLSDWINYFNRSANITFAKIAYINGTDFGENVSNFEIISQFNNLTSDFASEYLNGLPNQIAAARWDYSNGSVWFFSDFIANHTNDPDLNITNSVLRTIFYTARGNCTPPNISAVPIRNLAKLQNYVSAPIGKNYKQQKMNIYVWD